VTYRRAPTLVSYWRQGRFVLENYVTRRRVDAVPAVVAILDRASTWRTADALVGAHDPSLAQRVRRLVRALERATLLERRDATGDDGLKGWTPWLPHAGLLHFGTKNERYQSAPEASRAFRARSRLHPCPAPTKSYPARGRIALPAPKPISFTLQAALETRRTWRRFGRSPISRDDLATVLGLTWGVQRWVRDDAGNRVALKTAPSGGAMHPIEVYVAAFNVGGLARGLYHYDAARHALARVGATRSDLRVGRYLPAQPWYRGAAALLFLTAVVGREQWKYDSPRAYRAMLIDAGHLCQTCCLVATALDLAPFCSMALADSVVERDLGIDGVSEVALYAAGLGTRPE
jgi:SagB-type dehydrogenase family enzyme